jgi:tRNA(Ile)-lysidine synthase
VRREAEVRGLPFVLEKVDTRSYAEEYALSLEEAARRLRYRFLFAQAERLQAQAVTVAHTADDQVETVLMHLLRGSGLAGLRGMAYRWLPNAWSGEIPLARPLLGVWREQVVSYCQEHGLEPVWDRSNLDTVFYRNRLRSELIPSLEGDHPNLRQRVWAMARLLAGDYELVQQLVDAAWAECVLEKGWGYLALDLGAFRGLSVALQRHLLRRAMSVHRPGLRDIDLRTIERGLAFAAAPRGKCDLAAGLYLWVEGERLWLASWEADLPGGGWPVVGTALALNVPGRLVLPGGWVLEAAWVEDGNEAWQRAKENDDPYQAWLDAGAVQDPLVVRPQKPGERFQPLGMGGHSVKLSDLMVNLKVPRRARAGWPLVCTGGQVVWVPGYRLGRAARLDANTRRAIYLRLRPDALVSS